MIRAALVTIVAASVATAFIPSTPQRGGVFESKKAAFSKRPYLGRKTSRPGRGAVILVRK